MKPTLLIIELWGLGDLALAIPFIQATSTQYHVTLLAKPFAAELQALFFPNTKLVTFNAPWTAFRNKYNVWNWPIKTILESIQQLREKNDFAVSARRDPRDHFLMWITGTKYRLGFPRVGSNLFLTKPIKDLPTTAHRYEHWRRLAQELKITLPKIHERPVPNRPSGEYVLIHTGAGQPTRIWPLENYRTLALHLRNQGYQVVINCDQNQINWWQRYAEPKVIPTQTLPQLISNLRNAFAFIGNDSGPGHLAALMGIPTFTIFGPQLPQLFLPIHPNAQYIEGKPCPYKPCFDYCKFKTPNCITNITLEEVLPKIQNFLQVVSTPQQYAPLTNQK